VRYAQLCNSDPVRIIVTGGAGFIGSHLCERLTLSGHVVLCVDNFSSGNAANIRHLQQLPNFSLLQHDITSPLDIDSELIINLACPASPVQYQIDPVQTVKTAVHGSINMLELARQTKAVIFQASTSEVYGDPTVHPQREDYWGNVNPIGPRACYDEGKRCAETLFFDYRRQFGLNIKVARIFNTYGPRMLPGDGRVVSSLIVSALRDEPLRIFGDGSQTRSFCYVSDMLDGILALIEAPPTVTGPINLGNPHEVSILELAEQVLRLTGSKSRLVFEPFPENDPRRRRPDTTLAQTTLGWAPKIDLIDGLRETIQFFRGELNGATHHV